MDCAAGLGREAISALSASDEAMIITNPDLPSVADALKVIKIAQESNVQLLGTVVNRIKNTKNELTQSEISNILGIPIIAEIPEDNNVATSIALKRPIIEYAPNSPAAIEIRKLAAWLTGKRYEPPKLTGSKNLFFRFVEWIKR